MLQKLNHRLENRFAGSDLKQINSAFEFAQKAHQNQARLSGEPYIIHPLEVALLLNSLKLDKDSIIAGILHDLPEDTDITLDEIKKKFGKDVACLVDGVTKLSSIRLSTGWFGLGKKVEKLSAFERQVETMRKMFLATSKDLRVVLIKLADRLHNMRTLSSIDPDKQYRIARETFEIYAPLADRLGIGQWKGELEDLSFSYVYPDEARQLSTRLNRVLVKKNKVVEKSKKSLIKFLVKNKINIVDIHGRVKRLYSLWKKLKRYDNDISQIFDLVALRIIVGNEADCYRVLGLIHEHWRPLPDRIKDYIAIPKPNGYQSLHTTCIGPGGNIIEIQIRDTQMHEQAELGIAAHWYYSQEQRKKYRFSFRKTTRPLPKNMHIWIKELGNWQKSVKDPKELKEALTFDFFKDRIFVFTPQGDVKDLPIGSTPLDFAYIVHSEIGHHCAGAKVNGKIVTLGYELKNGDVVEIIRNNKSNPKYDWLGIAKTGFARGNIRKYLRENQKKIDKK